MMQEPESPQPRKVTVMVSEEIDPQPHKMLLPHKIMILTDGGG